MAWFGVIEWQTTVTKILITHDTGYRLGSIDRIKKSQLKLSLLRVFFKEWSEFKDLLYDYKLGMNHWTLIFN